MPSPRLIPLEDLFADPLFSGASLSADGERIAYIAPNHGRTQVWVRGIDDEHEDAVCITRDERRGIKSFFWTDDPRWLLYLQDTDGNEAWHLYRVDLHNPDAPAVDLTPYEAHVRVVGVEPCRTVAGAVLVGMNRRSMHFDMYRVIVATGETELVIEQPADRTTLFGNGGDAAFQMTLTDDGTYEYSALDPDGTPRLLHAAGGPEHPLGVMPTQPTPDNSGLLLGIFPSGSDHLALVRFDAATGEQRTIAEEPGHDLCTIGTYGAQLGPTLYFSRATGDVIAARFTGDQPLVKAVDPAFAPVLEALNALSDGVLCGLSSDVEGRRWVVDFISDTTPGLTYFYDHETRQSRLLFSAYPQLDPAELAPMRAVNVAARDGLPLHAFLTLPVGVDHSDLPLVLKVHGGPWSHDSWRFDREVQFFANRGYAVLQVNMRSSTGYGKKHLVARIHEWGRRMNDDLIDVADWAVAQGFVDPDRIAVYGGSYGGYAALAAVTFSPDYFAAAVDYVGISDTVNFLDTLPEFTRPYHINSFHRYIGDPSDPAQLAELNARSPLLHVDKIVKPLMVVQGANDVRVVQAQADNIVSALRDRGIDVEYLLAPDEGHGFANPENLLWMFRSMESFLGTHLGGRTDV